MLDTICRNGVDHATSSCEKCTRANTEMLAKDFPEEELTTQTLNEMYGFGEAMRVMSGLLTGAQGLLKVGTDPKIILNQMEILVQTFQTSNDCLFEILEARMKEKS